MNKEIDDQLRELHDKAAIIELKNGYTLLGSVSYDELSDDKVKFYNYEAIKEFLKTEDVLLLEDVRPVLIEKIELKKITKFYNVWK